MHRFAIIALAFALALPACGDSSSGRTVTQPMAQPTPTDTGPKVTPLTKADIAKVEADFVKARAIVAKADALREAAEKIEREQSRDAANDQFLQAKRLYTEASQSVEHWIEPELGSFTQAQVDGYLSSYTREIGTWMKKSARIGKVHD